MNSILTQEQFEKAVDQFNNGYHVECSIAINLMAEKLIHHPKYSIYYPEGSNIDSVQFKDIVERLSIFGLISATEVTKVLTWLNQVDNTLSNITDPNVKPHKTNNNNSKPSIMKTKVNTQKIAKQSVNILDKVLSGVFGTTHFIATGVAELSLEAEAATRQHTSGKSKELIKQHRYASTHQSITKVKNVKQMIKEENSKLRDKLKEMAKTKSTTTITRLQPEIVSTVKETV
jgi:hypothetical protein